MALHRPPSPGRRLSRRSAASHRRGRARSRSRCRCAPSHVREGLGGNRPRSALRGERARYECKGDASIYMERVHASGAVVWGSRGGVTETAIWAVRGGGTWCGRTVPSVTAPRRRPERLSEKLKICMSIYVFARFCCAYMCALSLPTRGAPSPQLLRIAHVPQEPAKGASEGETTGSGRQRGGKSCGIQPSVPGDRVCTRAGAWGQWAHR